MDTVTIVQQYQVTDKDFDALAQILGEKLVRDEPLAQHTSFRIGGPADLFARITQEDELVAVLKLCCERDIPLLVLGNGTNILISDAGWRGMVVENRLSDTTMTLKPEGRAILRVGSGAILGSVARKVAKEGWLGLEFGATIPGSIGGGVVSNAGAHGSDFSQVLTRVAVATCSGEVKIFSPEEMQLTYRNSRWRKQFGTGKPHPGCPGNEMILWAEFLLKRGNIRRIKAHIDEMTNWRREKQPQEPNAGSIFKNPTTPHPSAGRLIEQAGLKGKIIGGAQISPKHANFIVNNGGAKAEDVIALINLVRASVKELYGLELELEIELVGE